jgi:rod shape-determining protein MreB
VGKKVAFSFKNFFMSDVGIDLGTANTVIYVKNKGILVDEPSVVAIEKRSGKVVAVGKEAKEMLGRTHKDIEIIRPLKDGVIADFEATEILINELIKRSGVTKVTLDKIVVCVPSGITEVEKRAVSDSAEKAGAREVHLVAEAMSSAIGVGLPVEKAVGNLIVDIGGGTSEIAVISLSGIVNHSSIRVGGDEMNEAIIQYFKRNYNLLIGEKSAEEIKLRIGSATTLEEELSMQIKGRDLVDGIPKTIEVSDVEIRDALNESIGKIIEAVRLSLERTPPELASDILDRGIVLTGGGALLRNLDKRISEETSLPVMVADEPLTCVVRGTGKILDDMEFFRDMLIKNKRI